MNFFWTGVGAAVGLLLGMILHEYMHARTALMVGDRTPKLYGRVTLNPKAHVDPLGTLILPALFVIPLMVGRPFGFLFGYAKPVPTNPRAMRDQRWAPLFVALSGPATNFVIAAAAGAGLAAAGTEALFFSRPHALVLSGILTVNVFLGIINALPVPPLDGSRVLALFLSSRAAFKIDELGQYMILFLVILFLFFGGVIARMADPVCRVLSYGTTAECLLG